MSSEVWEFVRSVLAVVGGVGAFVGGLWVLLTKARIRGGDVAADEWRKVAEAREERIAELEAHVASLEERIVKLEGKYEALADLKVEQIADRVVERLVATQQVR